MQARRDPGERLRDAGSIEFHRQTDVVQPPSPGEPGAHGKPDREPRKVEGTDNGDYERRDDGGLLQGAAEAGEIGIL